MKNTSCLFIALMIWSLMPAAAKQVDSELEVLVVATKVKDLDEDHYLWAAEMVAARLEGNLEVVPGGLAAGLRFSRENPGTVAGILEVLIDVYTAFEEVRITCFDTTGRERWKQKTELNTGGSEEKMARNMLDRVISRIQKKKLACE